MLSIVENCWELLKSNLGVALGVIGLECLICHTFYNFFDKENFQHEHIQGYNSLYFFLRWKLLISKKMKKVQQIVVFYEMMFLKLEYMFLLQWNCTFNVDIFILGALMNIRFQNHLYANGHFW